MAEATVIDPAIKHFRRSQGPKTLNSVDEALVLSVHTDGTRAPVERRRGEVRNELQSAFPAKGQTYGLLGRSSLYRFTRLLTFGAVNDH